MTKYFPTMIIEYAAMLAVLVYLATQFGQTIANLNLHLLQQVTALLAR